MREQKMFLAALASVIVLALRNFLDLALAYHVIRRLTSPGDIGLKNINHLENIKYSANSNKLTSLIASAVSTVDTCRVERIPFLMFSTQTGSSLEAQIFGIMPFCQLKCNGLRCRLCDQSKRLSRDV